MSKENATVWKQHEDLDSYSLLKHSKYHTIAHDVNTANTGVATYNANTANTAQLLMA